MVRFARSLAAFGALATALVVPAMATTGHHAKPSSHKTHPKSHAKTKGHAHPASKTTKKPVAKTASVSQYNCKHCGRPMKVASTAASATCGVCGCHQTNANCKPG